MNGNIFVKQSSFKAAEILSLLKKTFTARADTKSPQPLKEYLAGLDSTTTAAYLGIAGQLVNLTERIIAVNKLQKKTGVYIFEKVADANVSNNELRTGDIIVDFDGKPVGSVDDLHRLLKQEMIGIRKPVGVLRNGHKVMVMVVPGMMR